MPPRPKPKLTTCRNRKTSFSLIAEVTEPEDSTSESPNQNEENSKSNEVFKFRGETSVCGEQPRIQADTEFTSLVGKLRNGNGGKMSSYGAVRHQEAPSSYDDLSGDNDSASDEVSSSASSGSSGLTNKLSNRQMMVLAMVLVNSFSSSLTVCLFPPFYPRLAEMKGTTASSYGMIIGTNCLVAFLLTPFIGNQLPRIGVKFSFCFGTFAGGVCCALSGLLEFFEPGQSFLIFSVLLRIFHACANALVITSTFTYQAMEFPCSVAKVFSITRAVMNVTQLFGPLIGGVMHEAGGFCLPFAVMGAFQVVLAFLSVFLMPRPFFPEDSRDYGPSKKKNKLTVSKILRIPTIWFSFLAFIVATMCNGFIPVNLEPEVLRQFQMSPIYIGLVFGLKDGANSIASPIWGFICDNNKKSVKPFLIVSAILVALSFLILGAGDILGIAVSLTIPSLVAALCINGVGIGGQQVVGVVDALHEASRAGYPENPAPGAGGGHVVLALRGGQVRVPGRLGAPGGRLWVRPGHQHRVRPPAGGGPGHLPLPRDVRVQPRGQGERPQVGGRDNSGAWQAEGGSGCVCERQQPQRVADGALGVRASEAECRPQDRQQHAARQEVELLPGG